MSRSGQEILYFRVWTRPAGRHAGGEPHGRQDLQFQKKNLKKQFLKLFKSVFFFKLFQKIYSFKKKVSKNILHFIYQAVPRASTRY